MSRYLLSIIGQSNERGTGPAGTQARTSGYGAPYIDPTTRGWWPACVRAMGARGKWLSVANTAQGGTSLRDSWVGFCRTWSSGMVVVRGSYALSGGGFWRCNATAGSVVSGTVAPTGTSSATFGGVPWTYVGAPAAGDVDGAIYLPGSARFDPNGYIAAAIAALNVPGYTERGVYLSLGQTDHSVGTTFDQFAACVAAAASAVQSAQRLIWLGTTCGMSGADAPTIAARDATIVNVVQAGIERGLRTIPGARRGANLRGALGIPAASASDLALNAVNNTDYLHLTSATYDQCGPIVAAALEAGGW